MSVGFDLGDKKIVALASDYDGTLAEEGVVSDATIEALKRFKAAGGSLILATGRVLPELTALFPEIVLFDLVVAENGAVLYWPGSKEIRPLAPAPPPQFLEKLTEMGVGPVSAGHCIVATWTPHEAAVLKAIKELQLELSIIFNKGAVMILPNGVNKASGVEAALAALNLTPSETAAFGDAENDLAFLKLCGVSFAVANALEPVKQAASFTTQAARGDGVAEGIGLLLSRRNAER